MTNPLLGGPDDPPAFVRGYWIGFFHAGLAFLCLGLTAFALLRMSQGAG